MKRFWLVLMSLGLIVVFSVQARAVDVKFSGSYYAAGMYLDKVGFNKTPYDYFAIGSSGFEAKTQASGDTSTAFYFQRLRVQTEFIVSPGLSLVTRFDAMQRAWGAARSAPGADLDSQSSGTRAENENIAFDRVYVSYTSPIGLFMVGYQPDNQWGTVFGNSEASVGKVLWAVIYGPFVVSASAGKVTDGSKTAIYPSTATDQDYDKYVLLGRYSTKNLELGFLYQYRRIANAKVVGNIFGVASPYLSSGHGLNPYAKAKIGPVSLEAEMQFAFGDINWEDGGLGPWGAGNMKASNNLTAYADALVDLEMFYFGGTFAYVSGDDPATLDKVEGLILDGGEDFNPCLIMFNYDLTYWAGAQAGYGGGPLGTPTRNRSPMTNAYFVQLRAGLRPVEKLDIKASVAYATADKTPQAIWVGREYGYEVDLIATYKITDNLSYMLGAGYFFTGDYYKGASEANEINDNNFVVTNKLTLTF